MSIILKTDYLMYEISETGQNLQFTEITSGLNRNISAPCAFITNNDRTIIPASGAAYEKDILTISFSDNTSAEIQVSCNRTYILLTTACKASIIIIVSTLIIALLKALTSQ